MAQTAELDIMVPATVTIMVMARINNNRKYLTTDKFYGLD